MTTTNVNVTTFHAHHCSSRWGRLKQIWGQLKHYLTEWRARAISRRELMTLDDHELRDIGLARIEADQEATKPFWEP